MAFKGGGEEEEKKIWQETSHTKKVGYSVFIPMKSIEN